MFRSLTVVILASNETDTLKKTVRGVLQSKAYNDISQIIIFLKSGTCISAGIAEEILKESNCNKIEIKVQQAAAYNVAFSEIPLLVKGSHFVIMASDGEMDTCTLQEFVRIAKQKPESIVCGSKWHKDSIVENASFVRILGSKMLNKFAAFVLGVKADDIFSVFQIYPLDVYKRFGANIYEYTIKPLRMGVEYIEIPTVYKKSKGRKGTFELPKLMVLAFRYILNVFKIRFTPKDRL